MNTTINPLLKSLRTIVHFLESESIPYMIIGGIANSFYGNPRQTFDIDIKIIIEKENYSAFIEKLDQISSIATTDPLRFLKDTGVIPVEIDTVRVDLIEARLPFEQESIKRSKTQKIFNIEAKITTVEDLIIQKAVSTRQKDWLDIAELIQRQHNYIDWAYLLEKTDELSTFLANPEISAKIRAFKNAK